MKLELEHDGDGRKQDLVVAMRLKTSKFENSSPISKGIASFINHYSERQRRPYGVNVKLGMG